MSWTRGASHPALWRRRSAFGSGPRRPLTLKERGQLLDEAEALIRQGELVWNDYGVLTALLRSISPGGWCGPNHKTIAREAGVSERSVRRALSKLRALGIVGWQNRLKRAGTGWRGEQGANVYVFSASATSNPSGAMNRARQAMRAPLYELTSSATPVIPLRCRLFPQ